jgi:protein SCO1/2
VKAMLTNKQSKIAVILVLLFGFALFYIRTDGFRAFTAEAARTLQLMEDKPEIPDVTFEDSNGRSYLFSEFKK